MENVHIVTVATHNEGTLNDIINNKYKFPVKVLGFGKKWTGFNMKYELVNEYISKLSDNDIIIFLDGFDSNIKLDPKKAIEIFKKNDYQLLVSKDKVYKNNTKLFSGSMKWIKKRIFNNSGHDLIANSGMYMGYVKDLKPFYKKSLSMKCKDDQVCLNNIREYFTYIDVDKDENIFQNVCKYGNIKYNNKAVFTSNPGISDSFLKRSIRGFREYTQFFLNEVIIIYILLSIYTINKFKNNPLLYTNVTYFIFISFITIIIYIDKSCIKT